MKNFRLLSLIGILFLLSGCSMIFKDYTQLVAEGKDAIASQKFSEADRMFSQALNKNPKGKEALIYQSQLRNYQKGLNYIEDGAYVRAHQVLERVMLTESGSPELAELARDKLTNLEKLDKSEDILPDQNLSEDLFPSVEVPKDKKVQILWDFGKTEMLNQFMAEWGEVVGSSYKSYDPQNNVDFYDLKLPRDVLTKEWKMVIDDRPVDIEWSATGEGESPYQLVAVYSDADTQKNLSKKTYFFVLADKEPKVYVTQQSQFNTGNYLYFIESQNPELREEFSVILKQSN